MVLVNELWMEGDWLKGKTGDGEIVTLKSDPLTLDGLVVCSQKTGKFSETINSANSNPQLLIGGGVLKEGEWLVNVLKNCARGDERYFHFGNTLIIEEAEAVTYRVYSRR